MNTRRMYFENLNPNSINKFPTDFNSNQRNTNLQMLKFNRKQKQKTQNVRNKSNKTK